MQESHQEQRQQQNLQKRGPDERGSIPSIPLAAVVADVAVIALTLKLVTHVAQLFFSHLARDLQRVSLPLYAVGVRAEMQVRVHVGLFAKAAAVKSAEVSAALLSGRRHVK